jgi:uncharacterized protein (DUF302 family)
MSTGEISYGGPGEAAASFQRAIVTDETFERVIVRLRKGVEAAGLWVLHEIDPQAVLRRGGHEIGAGRQILFFHPDLMVRLLGADQAALLEVPLKFAVLELADGTVSVRWIDPATAFVRYRNPSLDRLAAELAEICERVATAATGPEVVTGAERGQVSS